MFFCDPCRLQNGWREGILRSRGPCEVCGKFADCNDVKSSLLQRRLTSASYAHFVYLITTGNFKGERLGQAFCNHFDLVNPDRQDPDLFYERDNKKAAARIAKLMTDYQLDHHLSLIHI